MSLKYSRTVGAVEHAPGIGGDDGGKRMDQRRVAGPGLADTADDFAQPEIEGDIDACRPVAVELGARPATLSSGDGGDVLWVRGATR